MSAKAFFDTNILVYAFAQNDPRSEEAEALLAGGGRISVQILNEFVAVAVRKLGMPWGEVLQSLAAIRTLCPSPLALTIDTHESALRVAEQYGYRIYDSMVVAAALEAGCSTLYSEDLQHGQAIGGLTIRNPFKRR
jgi:predicted nucleic acid-binding protein